MPTHTPPNGTVAVGSLAYDTSVKRVGVVMAVTGARYALRPPQGGVEWDVPQKYCRPATTADQLSQALAEVNERSNRGTL
ncbi:hypothetical protein [Streptomyces clavuligerus]|uniref:Secreted protein n=1 Tax=Streptomyces clavuligerus TaxID=1901 RepID=B5GNR0_STRCL|nr:hypothetical protein [Streptomyces clavuligerus]ANW18777.1 hypothetical protein BB341_11325 [Streptomyces clavuligerus]AXU13343.1 hypothetical protein D1794_11710 [Streptomyces clavuligerus]EDY47882.1 hypothetical protein SSCG_00910 [Streptomyces clavuligerus]EFG08544.1 Hypothetical protein SCLAV_3472 [Streptomyces clavuligerus]MBY6303298.1 hypothetical protein [Streptomyces clavuligerus]